MAHSVLIVDDDAAFRDLASRVVTGHRRVLAATTSLHSRERR